MPFQPTYPGVYVQEIPSGVRTITGVATSITAFLGRARRGPVNRPVVINGFPDFERRFGGLWSDSTMSYAVRDFFMNGGGKAIVVRLFNPTASGPNRVTFSSGEDTGALRLVANEEGSWATVLDVEAIALDEDFVGEIAGGLEVENEQVFNLIVRNRHTKEVLETFNNVTVIESRRRIDRVLDNESTLLRVEGELPSPDDFDGPTLEEEGELLFALTPDPDADDPDIEALEALDGAVLVQDNYILPSEDVDDHRADYVASQENKRGLFALEDADLINLLCVPPISFDNDGDVPPAVWSAASVYAEKRRALLLVDPQQGWNSVEGPRDGLNVIAGPIAANKKNAALFFPGLRKPDPLRENQTRVYAPCGAVAGVFARTDAQRGVWKAPAGLDAGLVGVPALSVELSDDENGELNPLGINCLRLRPAAGPVLWGARTLAGNDQLASEWKYIPVRRLALFIEESLYRGTQWAVFEPNDEPLWAQLRLNIGAFMHNLFRQGAFQGGTPKDAYLVKCDKETTTQHHIDLGIVNILIGFAALKPAEFVFLNVQQMAGRHQA